MLIKNPEIINPKLDKTCFLLSKRKTFKLSTKALYLGMAVYRENTFKFRLLCVVDIYDGEYTDFKILYKFRRSNLFLTNRSSFRPKLVAFVKKIPILLLFDVKGKQLNTNSNRAWVLRDMNKRINTPVKRPKTLIYLIAKMNISANENYEYWLKIFIGELIEFYLK